MTPNLAWMVLVVALCNIAGIIPAYIISACYSWFKFVVKAFVGIVLLAGRPRIPGIPELRALFDQ